jgi:hypothetical protein
VILATNELYLKVKKPSAPRKRTTKFLEKNIRRSLAFIDELKNVEIRATAAIATSPNRALMTNRKHSLYRFGVILHQRYSIAGWLSLRCCGQDASSARLITEREPYRL